MSGITDLEQLLASLSPALREQPYVFCCLPGAGLAEAAQFTPLMTFAEEEGLTVVLTESAARAHGLAASPPFACITISVHSSLEAVGLTAAMAAELTRCGISANVAAAYHHDHIFVPLARAQDAMAALRGLQQAAAKRG
ncbi:ACT domain-containing protein [uncultured Aquitalea sp.]|uniref:ACT domain-containing protein n=1 Tax=uncultured Aquitalea sp. TaxID=540272 RepID=UPI0025FAFECE|nr:ACT domain-containing protein [uncultured Aquitalea sp.]